MNYHDTLMWKELNEAPEAVKTLKEYNKETLKKVADAIKEKNITGIYTIARGTSDHAMIYFKYLAESVLGIPVTSGSSGVLTLYGTELRFKNMLVVACSQSGKAGDAIEILKTAKKSGAVTIAITNDNESPVAKLAEFHLYCCAGEEKSVAATKTFTCQLALSRLLVEAIIGGFKCELDEKTLEIAIPVIDKLTETLSNKFSDTDECFVLSRGISSSVAFECALKLQETSYIKARAYHSSDFYHGPMAMIGEGTKVLLFASKHSLDASSDELLRQDYIKCAEKMCELGADLYVITDGKEFFEGLNLNIIDVPESNEESLTVFMFALFSQMLACKISCAKGLVPDSPRALKKITVTK